jgi:hypothetical protein
LQPLRMVRKASTKTKRFGRFSCTQGSGSRGDEQRAKAAGKKSAARCFIADISTLLRKLTRLRNILIIPRH